MSKTYTYLCKGTCSRQIDIVYDENSHIIESVKFFGGCNGNLKGIATLVKGKTIEEVSSLLKGITCNFKPTSCPDQLSKACLSISELEGIKTNI